MGRKANFSLYPGFRDYLAANPPRNTAPNETVRALLRKQTPRFFVADGEERPVGLHEDDIAQGRRDAAIGSHLEGRRERRAVSFLTPAMLRHMLDGQRKPWQLADDVRDPKREISYRLDIVPPSDVFYTLKGFLGERRALPGRDGPPGAQCNTLPTFKLLETQLALGYWCDDNTHDLARFDKNAATE